MTRLTTRSRSSFVARVRRCGNDDARPAAGARSGPVNGRSSRSTISFDRAGGGHPRRPHRGGHANQGDLAGRAEHQTDRSRWQGGDARADRQPHASAPRRDTWAGELHFDGVESRKKTIEMVPGRRRRAGRMGLQHQGLDPSSVRRRRQTVHPGRTGSDRAGQSGGAQGRTGLSEQPWAGGLRDQGERPRPQRLRQGSIMHVRPESRPA